MKILGTHHIGLRTPNFESLKAFYTETLGLPIVGAFAGRPIVFVQAGPTTIEIIGGDDPTGAEPKAGWVHFAFEVADVDATVAELAERGITCHIGPLNFPDPAEVRIAFFRDPDGNVLELVQPLAQRYPVNGLR